MVEIYSRFRSCFVAHALVSVDEAIDRAARNTPNSTIRHPPHLSLNKKICRKIKPWLVRKRTPKLFFYHLKQLVIRFTLQLLFHVNEEYALN